MAKKNPMIKVITFRLITFFLLCFLVYTAFTQPNLRTDIINTIDLFQNLLSIEGEWKIVGCFLVVLTFVYLLQGYKLLKQNTNILLVKIYDWLCDFFVTQPWKKKIRILIVTALVWLFWSPAHDALEWFEQKIDPIYIDQFSGLPEDQLVSIFEQNIVGDEYIRKVVIDSVRSTAMSFNTSPLSFYSPALFECSLNPLIIRDDRVAASWSQFTTLGLQGIKYQGRTYTLSEVIGWCENGKIHDIMGLSRAYHEHWLRKHAETNKVEAIDVYLCLFAPSLVGARGETKIYGKWDKNPQNYLQNQPFDGWYLEGRQIMHANSHKDGIITVNELLLAMEAKKSELIKKHFQTFSSHQTSNSLWKNLEHCWW